MKEIPTEDGLYEDVPAVDYHAWPALSVSRSKTAERSLKHYHYALTHPQEQTAAMALGTATHTAILEPDKFEAEYVKAPKFDRRTKVGKADSAQFELDHPDQERLTEDEWALCDGMREAVWEHPVARAMLSSDGINEASVVWTDAATGLRCKARTDRLARFDDWNHVVDLKTAKDASPGAFSRQIANLKYNWQAAHYLDGLYQIVPASRCWTFLVVENTPPHAVAIYTLDERAIDQGRSELARVVEGIANAERTNEWPGYPAELTEIDMPGWAQRDY